MASKDSAELGINERYPLGEYSFRIERSAGTSPNYDKIEAICTKDGKNARKSIQIPSSTQLLGWYVEANETEASVYVQTEVSGGLPWPVPVNYGSGSTTWTNSGQIVDTIPGDVVSFHQSADGGRTGSWNVIGSHPFEIVSHPGGTIRVTSGITVLGKPLYVYSSGRNFATLVQSTYPMVYGTLTNNDFYAALYGPPEPEDLLVGRFAIDLEDADGVGPGSDWYDPGDYDEDRDPEDPTTTLYLTVTGALSGRHNDPLALENVPISKSSYYCYDGNVVWKDGNVYDIIIEGAIGVSGYAEFAGFDTGADYVGQEKTVTFHIDGNWKDNLIYGGGVRVYGSSSSQYMAAGLTIREAGTYSLSFSDRYLCFSFGYVADEIPINCYITDLIVKAKVGYSYIPADKVTVKDYGCGGDGGHGGGGGAGASTVVVHKFATNQANSKEVTAIARRHGYGSGGGKGGKGGDGCILVYY